MAWHFHTGVVDTLAHVQTLLAKRSSVEDLWVVQASSELLDAVDAHLWTHPVGSFVPHVKWSGATNWTPLMARTRLWLLPEGLDWPEQSPDAKLLINLMAADLPAPVDHQRQSGNDDGARGALPCWRAQHGVVVVGRGREQVVAGRQLWKQAQGQGLNPQHRDLSGAVS